MLLWKPANKITLKNFYDIIAFFLGFRKIAIIHGDSMLPNLKENEVVFFKKYIKNKSILKVGQIIIFYHPLKNIRLIKRINLVNKNYIEVLGDNIEYSYDSSRFGFINNEKVIGIVTSKIFSLKLKNLLSKKKSSTFLDPKYSHRER